MSSNMFKSNIFNKNQIIIAVVIIVLMLGGAFCWFFYQKSKLSSGGTEQAEVFTLSGTVSRIDADNNFLMVKPTNGEKEVKVVVSEATKLIKLEFSFDPENPPKGGIFIPEQIEVEIPDFKAGDTIFAKARGNIAGKTKIDNIDFIHILP